MKKVLHWLDENLEEFLLVVFLIAMTLIMGIQVLSRYVLGQSLSCSCQPQTKKKLIFLYPQISLPIIPAIAVY